MKVNRWMLSAWVMYVIAWPAIGARDPMDEFAGYFDEHAKDGSQYRNCGRVLLGGDRAQVDRCVLQAFAAKHPFFVLYQQLGNDSEVATGLVLSEFKQLTVLEFDDGSCSTQHCAHAKACEAATITRTREGLHVTCVYEYNPHAGACSSTKYIYSKYAVDVQCVNEYDL